MIQLDCMLIHYVKIRQSEIGMEQNSNKELL